MTEQKTAAVVARTAVVRRVLVVMTVAATLGLTTAPAALAQPERWSEDTVVEPMHALVVFVFAPLAMAAVITLLALLPSMIRGQKDETVEQA